MRFHKRDHKREVWPHDGAGPQYRDSGGRLLRLQQLCGVLKERPASIGAFVDGESRVAATVGSWLPGMRGASTRGRLSVCIAEKEGSCTNGLGS